MNLRSMSCLLLAGLIAAGCVHHHAAKPKPTSAQTETTSSPISQHPIVTPDTSFSAKVVRYNPVGRFVVISFLSGTVPQPGQMLFLYRTGIKVGEIKITGPQRETDTVADVTTGDAQVGDEVRAQ